MAEPTTPTRTTNGYQTPQTPRASTPKVSTLALTEYTANPSPPSESLKFKDQAIIPEEFLLPNGYPDVP